MAIDKLKTILKEILDLYKFERYILKPLVANGFLYLFDIGCVSRLN